MRSLTNSNLIYTRYAGTQKIKAIQKPIIYVKLCMNMCTENRVEFRTNLSKNI